MRVYSRSFANVGFSAIMHLFLLICVLMIVWPLVYIVAASFSSPAAVISGRVWLWPVEPTLRGYQAVFKNTQLLSGFANSFFYMAAGTIINLAVTMLAAYPLSRKELKGRVWLSGVFIFCMLFNGGLIPTYLVVKGVGILNTRLAMLLPVALSIYNMIIARTYLQTAIPDEMYEAAMIDGCSDFQFLIKMVVPLSGPLIAVLALYYGVEHWNRYFQALIYLKDEKLYPLQIILRNILIMNEIDLEMVQDAEVLLRKQGLVDLLKYSVIVVASLPVLALYPFVQRFFVQGIMIGAVKG